MQPIDKIHHISAIVGDPNENIIFYRDVLGLKLVKQTVNFDDPHTYHLYFSNQSVDNGTIMTFFPWTNNRKGRVGSGQVGTIAFRIPKSSLPFWHSHLAHHRVSVKKTRLFNRPTLELSDSHGLALALVESNTNANSSAILGFHGAVLLSAHPAETVRTLTDELGLKKELETGEHHHLLTAGEARHHIIVPKTDMRFGRWGIGTVHHIAWSVPTSQVQKEWQSFLAEHQYRVTEVKDRKYFNAIYFPEHGNILFEIATEEPGFAVDEPFDDLGTQLMLPPQFESRRSEITAHLPRLDV